MHKESAVLEEMQIPSGEASPVPVQTFPAVECGSGNGNVSTKVALSEPNCG